MTPMRALRAPPALLREAAEAGIEPSRNTARPTARLHSPPDETWGNVTLSGLLKQDRLILQERRTSLRFDFRTTQIQHLAEWRNLWQQNPVPGTELQSKRILEAIESVHRTLLERKG